MRALAGDIDLSAVGDFVPMGGNAGFMGTFDGRGNLRCAGSKSQQTTGDVIAGIGRLETMTKVDDGTPVLEMAYVAEIA